MKRDKTHMEFVLRWAEYCSTHPRSEWKKQLNPFIDAQINMANRFYRNLAKTKEGREKIKELKGISLR